MMVGLLPLVCQLHGLTVGKWDGLYKSENGGFEWRFYNKSGAWPRANGLFSA